MVLLRGLFERVTICHRSKQRAQNSQQKQKKQMPSTSSQSTNTLTPPSSSSSASYSAASSPQQQQLGIRERIIMHVTLVRKRLARLATSASSTSSSSSSSAPAAVASSNERRRNEAENDGAVVFRPRAMTQGTDSLGNLIAAVRMNRRVSSPRWLVKSVPSMDEFKGQCIICQVETPDVRALPCMHTIMCRSCTQEAIRILKKWHIHEIHCIGCGHVISKVLKVQYRPQARVVLHERMPYESSYDPEHAAFPPKLIGCIRQLAVL